ncbi:MAG: hypothetical protein WBC18_26830 [Ottowia sp.]|uniref:hypothetical protein n=1 Tax=unclassified Ottowia TaxID=2645081 RepID=UPI003C3018CC
MRPTIILKAALLAAACLGGVAALAQAPAAPSSPAPASGSVIERQDPLQHDRRNQRIERIRVEDAGSRVDELRSGGETKSITVQPKASVPAYEVRPADNSRINSGESGPGSAGQRVWKVLNF